jgi:hypothetical protein
MTKAGKQPLEFIAAKIPPLDGGVVSAGNQELSARAEPSLKELAFVFDDLLCGLWFEFGKERCVVH